MAFAVPSGWLPARTHGGSQQAANFHFSYPAIATRQLQAGALLGSLPSAVTLATASLVLAAGVSNSQRLTSSRQGVTKVAIRKKRFSAVTVLAAPDDGANEAKDDPLLAEARAAAEAAKLELEAAKLRAEVDAMQRSAAEKQLQERATRLLGDLPGLGLQELMTRLKETEGLELVEEQGQRLAKACGLGQVSEEAAEKLRRAEAFNLPDVEELRQKATPQPVFFTSATLTSEPFDKELKRIVEDLRVAKQRQAEQQAFERKAQEANSNVGAGTSTPGPSATSTPGPKQGENDDRSTGSRILASLCYLLPLSQAFQYAIPFASIFPLLQILFGPVAIVTLILNAIPAGSLIAFVVFIFLAQWKEGVPRLVRFSLEQSVLLNIALTIPALLLAGLELSAGGASDGSVIGGAATFFAMLAVTVYCVASNIDGKEPDGLGFISATTYGVIDQVAEDNNDNNRR